MRWFLLMALGVTACGHGEDFVESERPAPSTLVGAACNDDSDCQQVCLERRQLPDGFCTIVGCRNNEECPAGTVCINEWDGVCLYPCSVPLDCSSGFMGRSGYSCRFENGFDTPTSTQVRYRVCLGD